MIIIKTRVIGLWANRSYPTGLPLTIHSRTRNLLRDREDNMRSHLRINLNTWTLNTGLLTKTNLKNKNKKVPLTNISFTFMYFESFNKNAFLIVSKYPSKDPQNQLIGPSSASLQALFSRVIAEPPRRDSLYSRSSGLRFWLPTFYILQRIFLSAHQPSYGILASTSPWKLPLYMCTI